MEEYSQEIVDNIKHEPEVHYVCYLPEDPETEDEPEVKEIKIVLRKFDETWKIPPKLFGSYFVCGKCGFEGKQTSELEKHLKVCKTFKKCEVCRMISKSEKIIKCSFCELNFKCTTCKSNHILQDHRKGSTWICTKCDYRSLSKESLRAHYPIHVKKFSCSTCGQNFSHKTPLKNHQLNNRHGDYAAKPEVKFECSACIHSFATKRGLRYHEKYFHSKLKYHCDFCGKTRKTKDQLRRHLQTHFKCHCQICHQLYAEHRRQSHIENHSTTFRLECDSYDKVYYKQKDLNRHKISNHEIDQVQCDLCQKIFENKILLRHHMRNHLMVSCPSCSRTLSKASLNQHMKMHSSKRASLACSILYCHQKFSSVKELEEHMKIHAGKKIYKCPNCNHQTKRLNEIKSHMKCHQS